ncbi:hypothetical protein MTO96_025282 [Rhipicephalus appendiculatus]
MFAVADEEEDDKNDEQKAERKRQYGRRKSVVAAAFAKFRKAIKAQQQCLEAKQYLDSLLNDTRDPCTDFYGYVCGSWHSKGGSFHMEAVRDALFRLNRTLLNLGQITRVEEIRQGMHLLKPIYSGCYTFMSTEIELRDALLETQTYLDIMQLMRASNFFDVVRFLVRQSLQIGVATLFRIRFFYEDGRPMMYINSGFTIAQKIGLIFYEGETRKTFERVLRLWLNQSDANDRIDLLRNMDVEVDNIFENGNDTGGADVLGPSSQRRGQRSHD